MRIFKSVALTVGVFLGPYLLLLFAFSAFAQPQPPPTADQVATQLCSMGRTQDEKNAAAIIANNLKTISDLQAEVAKLTAAAAAKPADKK